MSVPASNLSYAVAFLSALTFAVKSEYLVCRNIFGESGNRAFNPTPISSVS